MKVSRAAKHLLLALAAAAMLASCSSLNYYAQAAHGQLSLLNDARPIEDWLSDEHTDAKLKLRLATARQIRTFAVQELGLPDNKSYRNYAALKRPFVLWNVVAAPELSLKPVQWCFPVAGCVSYKGYYSKDEAVAFARSLREEGMDVQVGGVPAYSTLGWFNDPLVSTFINYPDAELARLLFHELSHQVVYVQGDSQFNESFASAVEEAGVERWLAEFGNPAMHENFLRFSARKKQFLALLMDCRRELERVYTSQVPDADKRAAKARLFKKLQDDYQVLKTSWGGYAGYDRFFAEPLSNAHLAAVATYNEFIPAFRALLAREKTFPRFYAAARALAELDKEERHRRLQALAASAEAVAVMHQ
ncbi:aminopeptidase [Massilia sp. CF038]|uniref:aminopeptidase n=1 Tax=Massilia sp. CF038 TaxID=1881045 RepID=UPI00091FAC0E|nr:aminopeptidase [Massilia sp. CF038]SHH57362.1 Predicted aminopeptidase [Massilia sp. CF038]